MSPSWLPSSEAEVRELAPVLCQYGLDPAGIILSRSSLAHTNRVYLVQPAGAPTMVLRVVGETYGATLSKPDHLTLEVETLDYLASVNFRLTPAVLPTVDGTRIAWSGSQPYMLLSFMPGAPAGSFNDLSGLSAPRRERLFWSAGRMSRVLRPFQPTTPVREKTLYQFCRESAHRLATVIARLPEAGQALVVSQSHMLEPFALTTVDELGRSGYDDLPKQIVHTDPRLQRR